jgi:CubicO group peptidase (beta-lactamase class C family)
MAGCRMRMTDQSGREAEVTDNGAWSRARLGRMHDVLTDHVERGAVPGVVTLVSRRGEAHVDAIGTRVISGPDPIQRDTIFRIASMTKPIAAAATMILVEECALRLDDPVDELLPELANRQVLRTIDADLDDTVPARRSITVRDLLTLRMGFGFVFAPNALPIERAASELEVMPGPPNPQRLPSPDEWLRRLGTLPLMRQPGERWMYPTGFSVLGVLLARAAGQPLEQFLRERIFDPLGMKDTRFSVPAAKRDRLAGCYALNAETGALDVYDDADASQWHDPPAFPDAEGGLVSTVDDYVAFGQMMLNKGQYGNERILSRASVELMTTGQITPEQRVGAEFFLETNRDWGFGVSIITQRDDVASTPGRFGWDGGFSTSWYADPREDLTAILMTQVLGFPSRIDREFWILVYAALAG